MISEEQLEQIQTFAEQSMPPDDVHGWGHIQRVVSLCEEIAMELPCDIGILRAAAFLHDVGRSIEKEPMNKGIHHAELSVQVTAPFLKRMGISGKERAAILACIREHSFSAGTAPASVEAQILSDADKLDAIGAIGIYRMVLFQAPMHGGLRGLAEHLDEKLLRLRDLLLTVPACRIAEPRHTLLVAFREEIARELIM